MNQRLFVLLMSVFVAATAVYGFWLSGSPSAERARRLDAQRINDLQQISYGMDQYWEFNGKLPESLEEAQRMRNIFFGNTSDPDSRAPYAFVRKDEDTYDLCTTFSFPTDENGPKRADRYVIEGSRGSSFWNHAAGRACFTIDIIKPPFPRPVK